MRDTQIRGALYGLLVGDALGVPYEFNDPDDLPPRHDLEFTPPQGFRRSHGGTPPGTWSDDGAQALCLLASLLDCGRLDPEDLANRIARWYGQGYCAVDNVVFDVGITTSQAISAYRSGTPALQAGSTHARSNGNGSLMRVLPLALWHQGTDAELVTDAHTQSLVTHGHPRSQVCCAAYCLWGREVARNPDGAWERAIASLRETYPPGSELAAELESALASEFSSRPRGTGYVVDCLLSARWAVDQGSYEDVVRSAVALGNDTDTTACVAGGIAGLRDGLQAIPSRWLENLRGRELVEPLLERLLDRASGPQA